MHIKTPHQVATHLHHLYTTEFGNRAKGRFVISHFDLRALAGRSRLERGVINKIANHLHDRGLVLIHLASSDLFAVESEFVVKNWRPVPRVIVTRESRRKVQQPAEWPFPNGV